MSDKKLTIIDRCKNVKAVFDVLSIPKKIVTVLGFISSLGGVGYLAIDMDEESKPGSQPEPATSDKVDELKIIHISPDYALKGHAHEILLPPPEPKAPEIDIEPMINRAVEAYARKHDPQGLGH